jgi:D-alanine transaminase
MDHDRRDELVFWNGAFLPRGDAAMDVLDRGVVFGDGVYEVVRFVNGRPFEMARHLARLERSLSGIELPLPMMLGDVEQACCELVERRGLSEAKVYLQVTRGPAERNHVMPEEPAPTLLLVADEMPPVPVADAEPAAKRVTACEDNRWGDCWIKSLMLLPNSLAKTRAKRAGFDDAIFVRPPAGSDAASETAPRADLDDGEVTESTVANVLIVTAGSIRTHPADRRILGGVTRDVLLELARSEGIEVDETPASLAQAKQADEILLCGTTASVAAVTFIDDQRIANAEAGPMSRKLHRLLISRMRETCGLDRGTA